MSGQLQREIRQAKPFGSLEVEAFLNVLRTAGTLTAGLAALLKPHGITHQQYNVLRILRGAEPDGLPCMEIAGRMVTREPDVTRLLNRLVRSGLATRDRDDRDRRVVRATIAAAGADLLGTLDGKVERLHHQQLGHLGPRNLNRLIRLLERSRIPPP